MLEICVEFLESICTMRETGVFVHLERRTT